MIARSLLLGCALVLGTITATAQPLPVTPQPMPSMPHPVPTYYPAPSTTMPQVPPAEKSIDELVEELQRIQVQKSALEKAEADLKASLRRRMDQLSDRLKQLGVPKDAKEPDRVGNIIIEGNSRTSDTAILNLVKLVPGQVIQAPAIETARKNLEKAGFQEVIVEALANQFDPAFKDIRVKIQETPIANVKTGMQTGNRSPTTP